MKTNLKAKKVKEVIMSKQKLIHSILQAALMSGIDRWLRAYVFALPLAWMLGTVVWTKMVHLRARFSQELLNGGN
jgi:sensor c-di-GMP phosphodiesterase-like protein